MDQTKGETSGVAKHVSLWQPAEVVPVAQPIPKLSPPDGPDPLSLTADSMNTALGGIHTPDEPQTPSSLNDTMEVRSGDANAACT